MLYSRPNNKNYDFNLKATTQVQRSKHTVAASFSFKVFRILLSTIISKVSKF